MLRCERTDPFSNFVWWLGPVSGAIVAGFLYGKVFTLAGIRKSMDM